jgi:MOSC domain-containing protein YiiM
MPQQRNTASVLAVCLKKEPGLPKMPVEAVRLVENHGVEGDYHAGKTIRHRYLARKDPTRPNNRQVLLVDAEIIDQVEKLGIRLKPGELGENITLEGIDLMALAVGTRLQIGPALVELTEAREPCHQLDGIHPGLQDAVRTETKGQSQPRAGMLGVVLTGGMVKPGDRVRVMDQGAG